MTTIPELLSHLSTQHQTVLAALTCEKMRASIVAFDAEAAEQGTPLFEEAITALLAFGVGQPLPPSAYAHLTERLAAFWPDLDESTNAFASYAFDACVALSEALAYVQNRDSTHVLQCLTAATDTIDMYVQDTQAVPLAPEALNAFVGATPLMQREQQRQAQLVQALLAKPELDATFLMHLRQLNGHELLVDLTQLEQG